jgi:hypothetical protein
VGDDAHVLGPRSVGEDAVHQLIENDRVDQGPVIRLRQLGGDPAGGQRGRVHLAIHRVPGAKYADPPAAVAGGLLSHHLGDVQSRQGQVRSGLFEGDVRGVVRADEEVRARPGQPLGAARERGPDRHVVALVPGQHAARHGDAVQGDIRVVVRADPPETFLAEGEEAQGRTFRAVREDAEVSHGASTFPLWR